MIKVTVMARVTFQNNIDLVTYNFLFIRHVKIWKFFSQSFYPGGFLLTHGRKHKVFEPCLVCMFDQICLNSVIQTQLIQISIWK